MNDSDFEPGHRLEDIAWAYARKDYEALTKSSIGRLFEHFQQSGQKNFAILTAWRPDRPKHENEAAMLGLKQAIRSRRLGFINMHGFGQEEGGVVSREPSLFVPGMKPEHAISLGGKYRQNAVMFAGPETQGKVHLHDIAADKAEIFDRFHPKTISTFYSRLRGEVSPHTFTLDSSQAPDPHLRPATAKSFLHYPLHSLREGMVLQSYIRRAREYLEPV